MRHGLEASLVQGGEQYTGIAIAHVSLSSGQLSQPAHDGLYYPARAVTAPREPYRVTTCVISNIEKGACSLYVIAGEMAVRREALGVEDDLGRSVRV
jgi:hypothetical protein